jgi:putative transposase
MINKQYETPLKDVVSSTILGTQEFISFIKDKHLSSRRDDKDLPALKTLKGRVSIDKISEEVDRVVKEDKSLSRNIKIYLSRRLTGKRLDDIGVHFEIRGSGVCQAARRINDLLKKDKALLKTVKKIETNLPK